MLSLSLCTHHYTAQSVVVFATCIPPLFSRSYSLAYSSISSSPPKCPFIDPTLPSAKIRLVQASYRQSYRAPQRVAYVMYPPWSLHTTRVCEHAYHEKDGERRRPWSKQSQVDLSKGHLMVLLFSVVLLLPTILSSTVCCILLSYLSRYCYSPAF